MSRLDEQETRAQKGSYAQTLRSANILANLVQFFPELLSRMLRTHEGW